MSHLSKVFTDVPVEIQDRSGFDLSHENLFTTKVGTLTPCLVEEVMPGDIFDIGVWFQTKTPPLATPFYGKVDAKVEVFACANSVLWAGWKQFIQQRAGHTKYEGQGVTGSTTGYTLPGVSIALNQGTPGTLADYLGMRIPSSQGHSSAYVANALPFIMYHKIVDDYYRNSLITKPLFNEAYGTPSNSSANSTLCNLPYLQSVNTAILTGWTGNNGHKITDLRQRCWAKDAYTTATNEPQFGAESVVMTGAYEVGEESVAGFSIQTLRLANALQKFLERSNLAGTRYEDFVMAHYGVYPSDAMMDRPMFLGQVVVPVYANSVANTSPQEGSVNNKNFYSNLVGGQAGNSVSVGDGRICENFKCNWHGFIMGIYSLVPHAYYGTGIRKYLNVSNASQFAFPEFAGVGDEEIWKEELARTSASGNTGLFGYNRRYYRYLYHDDEVHGQFMNGETLDSFVLQRSFNSGVTLGTQFMEISTTAMDDVLAYMDQDSGDFGRIGFQAMVDMYWDIKVLRRLPESPLPHL